MPRQALSTGDEFGPAMRKLVPQEQIFVCNLFANPKSVTKALSLAGYTSPNNNALRQKAHQLLHTARVAEAVREESRRRTVFLLPKAQTALNNLLDNPQSTDHFKAIKMVRDDGGVSMAVERVLNVKHEIVTSEEKLNALKEFAAKHGGTVLGVPIEDIVEPPTTDAEFIDITPSSAGLEDLI
jgi:hypothetical protein